MYFATLDSDTGKLVNLQMSPTQIKRLRVQQASTRDLLWLRERLNREGSRFGTSVQWDGNKTLTLEKLAHKLLIKRYVGNLTSDEQLPIMKIGVAVASWRKGLWPPKI